MGKSLSKVRLQICRQAIEQVGRLESSYPSIRKITANTGWLFFDNVLRLIGVVVVNAWVVRYLGPEWYGDLSYALAFTALFTPLATFGLSNIVIRELVQDAEHIPQILSSAFAIMMVSSSIATIAPILLIFLLRPDDSSARELVFILAIGTLFQPFTLVDSWFQSQLLSKYTVYARNIALAAASALKIVCVMAHAPLLLFAGLYTLESGLFLLVLVIVYQRRADRNIFTGWGSRLDRIKPLLRDSWPLLFEGVAVMIYMRIDQTMLGQMLHGDEGSRTVGLYAAAVRLSEVWYFIPAAIVSSVFPSIVRSKGLNRSEYYDRIQWLFNVITLLSYVIAITMSIFAGFTVNLLYGSEYQDAAPVLVILTWANVWVSLGLARGAIVRSENKQIFTLVGSLLGAVSNILLNLLLIPRLGAIGPAIATTISYGISAYGSSFLFPSLRHLGKMQTLALIYPNPIKGLRRDQQQVS